MATILMCWSAELFIIVLRKNVSKCRRRYRPPQPFPSVIVARIFLSVSPGLHAQIQGMQTSVLTIIFKTTADR
jgi:hypothetical protein